MKTKWLDRRIAHPGPYLCLCTSDEQYQRALKECRVKPVDEWIKNTYSDATVHHLNNDKGESVCVVCIRPKESTTAIEIAGLLVHEAVHIWQEYCSRIGERSPGREQEAYGIQAISQELLQAYTDQEVA